ncbi:hypothetical protein PSTT_00896 [Puccinia striiformis]|uniref:CBF1-interacting co-repressor CIR N-terminal domain-containing protein n=1 Tax=Puccinia striiformis TaxID=27350 RepID=A0A2S4W5P5_9BASI|nr:hypothetical protein PSTT_00896 [Puccinia striiformis]
MGISTVITYSILPFCSILYHKSYHVYNRENVERVKRDELRAELEAEVKTQSTIAANSEARLTLLRNQKQQLKQESSRSKERRIEKALDDQLKGKKSNHKILPKDDDDDQEESIQQSTSSNKTTDNSSIIDPKNGHINFWSGLENQSTSKQFGREMEDMITMRLDKPAHELNPWYSQNDLINGEDKKLSDRKLKQKASKDEGFKQQNDPLTFIKKSLYPSSSTKYTNPRKRKERQASRSPSPVPKTLHKSRANESEEEEEAPKILKVDISAERLRAEALLKRHRKNNSSSSFSEMSGYSDVYNRHEIDVIKNQSRNRHHPYSSSSRNIKQYRD